MFVKASFVSVFGGDRYRATGGNFVIADT